MYSTSVLYYVKECVTAFSDSQFHNLKEILNDRKCEQSSARDIIWAIIGV